MRVSYFSVLLQDSCPVSLHLGQIHVWMKERKVAGRVSVLFIGKARTFPEYTLKQILFTCH